MKSAWELALEKLEGQGEMAVDKLNDQQKEAIGEIRRTCQARIAEEEINAESRVRKAVQSGAYDEVQKIREQTVSAKARLSRDMEKKIARVKAEPGSAS